MLAILSTHPIQYHAPLYRALSGLAVPFVVIYGSNPSAVGYRDEEFGEEILWDSNLLGGYNHIFLKEAVPRMTFKPEEVRADGLSKVLRSVKPAAVMLTGYALPFHLQAFTALMGSRHKKLFRAETNDAQKNRNAFKQAARDGFLRFFYKAFDAFLYVGKESRAHYERLGCAKNKMFFSPYSVDSASFNPVETAPRARHEIRKGLGLAEKEIVFAYSGKLVSRKDPALLIEAAGRLPAEIRERVCLMFLGSGELEQSLKEFARKANIRAVFPGFINQKEIGNYYYVSDLLVLPSLHSETWGLVVNEALHHGLPCIVSTAVGCGRDLISPGNTGEIFKAGDSEDLAAALKRALSWIKQPETGFKCRRRIAHYSINRAARGIQKAYETVTGEKRVSP